MASRLARSYRQSSVKSSKAMASPLDSSLYHTRHASNLALKMKNLYGNATRDGAGSKAEAEASSTLYAMPSRAATRASSSG